MVVALRPETGEAGAVGHTELFQSLGEEHQKNVVRWALANRARVSEEARVALNNALIGNVSVRGFLESNVPDAPAIMLIQPVRNAALVVDAIAQSILAMWRESRAELRGIVEAAVNNRAESADSARDEGLSATLASAHPEYSSDDVSLMIALVMGESSSMDEETHAEEPTPDVQRIPGNFFAELREKIAAVLAALEEAAVMPTPDPAIEEVVPVKDESVGSDSETEIADVTDDVEKQYLREIVEALQRENAVLKADKESARQENTELKVTAETAREAIGELRAAAEATHLSDVEAQRAEETLAAPPDFGDVASVIDFVENRWPNELRLALNKNSDPRLYFDQPNQVYSALEWLATTYRNSRTGEKSVSNLDVSLFTTCGWRYRPFQPDAAPGKYRSDYQTTDAGVKYTLDEHIGRGAGRTPGQIRVAFAWDEERKMVVVGYIGRHQRSNTT